MLWQKMRLNSLGVDKEQKAMIGFKTCKEDIRHRSVESFEKDAGIDELTSHRFESFLRNTVDVQFVQRWKPQIKTRSLETSKFTENEF